MSRGLADQALETLVSSKSCGDTGETGGAKGGRELLSKLSPEVKWELGWGLMQKEQHDMCQDPESGESGAFRALLA